MTLNYCNKCKEYTLNNTCTKCNGKVKDNKPAKFSMERDYSKQRLKIRGYL